MQRPHSVSRVFGRAAPPSRAKPNEPPNASPPPTLQCVGCDAAAQQFSNRTQFNRAAVVWNATRLFNSFLMAHFSRAGDVWDAARLCHMSPSGQISGAGDVWDATRRCNSFPAGAFHRAAGAIPRGDAIVSQAGAAFESHRPRGRAIVFPAGALQSCSRFGCHATQLCPSLPASAFQSCVVDVWDALYSSFPAGAFQACKAAVWDAMRLRNSFPATRIHVHAPADAHHLCVTEMPRGYAFISKRALIKTTSD